MRKKKLIRVLHTELLPRGGEKKTLLKSVAVTSDESIEETPRKNSLNDRVSQSPQTIGQSAKTSGRKYKINASFLYKCDVVGLAKLDFIPTVPLHAIKACLVRNMSGSKSGDDHSYVSLFLFLFLSLSVPSFFFLSSLSLSLSFFFVFRLFLSRFFSSKPLSSILNTMRGQEMVAIKVEQKPRNRQNLLVCSPFVFFDIDNDH